MRKKQKYLIPILLILLLSFAVQLTAYAEDTDLPYAAAFETPSYIESLLYDLPEYDGEPYTVINQNTPYFTEAEITVNSFESYGELDEYGRCTAAFACLGPETLPTEKRGAIGQVKPTGWHTVKYPELISDNYLYNRCHLIAYELSAENANEQNLMTGTRYMNISGMLDFENKTADYIKDTGNHVMYRSTPIFLDSELVCRGILLEGLSVEDQGDGVQFCIYCHNVQPGITIDYTTGESWDTDTSVSNTEAISETQTGTTYILNLNSHIFHYPWCDSVAKMSEKNKQEYTCDREDLIADGYAPCKICNP